MSKGLRHQQGSADCQLYRALTREKRPDGNNGLLLSPHIDKLFDQG
ncbi:HNH endonuclease [Aeromonas hydrophila]|nr:hypothetical protein [Aeromonas hydrophila]